MLSRLGFASPAGHPTVITSCIYEASLESDGPGDSIRAYDVLDLSQWKFYVVPAAPVRDSGFKSLTIAWVARHAQPLAYEELADAIETAGATAG